MINEFVLHTSEDNSESVGYANPDFINIPDRNIKCNWKTDVDSVCFTYVNGRLICLDGANIPHYRLANMCWIPSVYERVNGRAWTSKKIISFWVGDRDCNNHFPSSKEVAEIIALFKTDKTCPLNISNYTMMFQPEKNCFVEIPIDEYVWMNLSGNEDIAFWIDKDISNHGKEFQLRNYRDSGLDWDKDTNPYEDPKYRNFVAEGKIRLSDSDIKKIVTEVVKKILNLV